MLQFGARLVGQKIFKLATNLQKFPKVKCFSTTKIVNDLEYLDGITRDPLLATPGSTVSRNPVKLSTKIPDEVWLSTAKLNQFLTYLPDIQNELEAKLASLSPLDNGKRIRKILDYVLPGSKRYLGLTATETYKILTPENKHTSENLRMAYNLGWCYEILFEAINMADDIIDKSLTRRNRVCWHELPNVGPTAVNDAFMLEAAAFYLLRKHFSHLDCYMRLLEIFQESTLITYIGQHVDVTLSKTPENLTVETFEEICTNISTYIGSYIPVALGMTLADYDLREMKKARKILTSVGYFYAIQNDINDCFGDKAATGKLGTDIQEGKCRWSNVVAMQLASPEQKVILEDNLGRNDPKCVAKVMNVYRELNLPKVYNDYCENLCSRLDENLQELDGGMKDVCQKLAEAVMHSMHKSKPMFV